MPHASQGSSLLDKKEQQRSQPPSPTQTLYYTVFPGNGPSVIRDALARRSANGKVVWKEVPKDAVMFQSDQQINFIWKPTNFNYKLYSLIDKVHAIATPTMDRQLIVNHLENIRGICTKTGLVRTLKQFYKDRSDARK